jgi:hypothetical protein
LVSKGELLARAWPDTVVEESNLKVQIAGLRRALGCGCGGNRYLATFSGRGYRFIAQSRSRKRSRSYRRRSLRERSRRTICRPGSHGPSAASTLSRMLRPSFRAASSYHRWTERNWQDCHRQPPGRQLRARRLASRSAVAHRSSSCANGARCHARAPRRRSAARFDRRAERQVDAAGGRQSRHDACRGLRVRLECY